MTALISLSCSRGRSASLLVVSTCLATTSYHRTNQTGKQQIEYSSFDPIFWLHHATVDRAFAIWQALYPNSYVEPTVDEFGTYTIPAGSTEDETTPLTPFHKNANGDFWDSTAVRNTSTFGYSYPEVQWWNSSVNTKQAVNALYGNSGVNGKLGGRGIVEKKRSIHQQQPRSAGLGSLIKAGLGGNNAIPVFTQDAADVLDNDANPNTYREYIANIRVSKYALSSSFFIHIFLGDFSSDPSSWTTDPNLVGTHTIFTSARLPANCDSCKNVTVTGTIPLTMALVHRVEAGQLDGKDVQAVEHYLTQNLHWRVTLVSSNLGHAGHGTREHAN